MDKLDGTLLMRYAESTFGTKKVTKDQLAYLIKMLTPSSYILENHRVKNHPITFHISGHNMQKAQSHRPWQVGIINDQSRDKAVIKSRQLGLSEMGVAEMLHFADVFSHAGVKCL